MGYGDVVPKTWQGRLLTIFYAIVGVYIIWQIISDLRERFSNARVQVMEDKLYKKLLSKSPEKMLYKKMLAKTDDSESFFLAYLPPLVLILSCVALASWRGSEEDQNWSVGEDGEDNHWFIDLVDLLYYATCTITTIGYGDLAPKDDRSRLLAVFFIPVSLCALATILRRWAVLSSEHKVEKAIQELDKDGITELEFFRQMLLSTDLVSEDILDRLHSEFAKLDTNKSGVLDMTEMTQARARALEESRQDNSQVSDRKESPTIIQVQGFYET